jgi:hypothetical protein
MKKVALTYLNKYPSHYIRAPLATPRPEPMEDIIETIIFIAISEVESGQVRVPGLLGAVRISIGD